MKENTVYLLYNTNASNVKLHRGPAANVNREIETREWEYEDKDEFTIMYSSDDVRKYTDIKILSKTKLRERPKSADQLIKKPKVSVEGVLMRRSNSLSIIEEDLIVLRKCPLIKPLLSETEIKQLHKILQECRTKKQVTDKTESGASDSWQQLFPSGQNLRKSTGDLKGTHLYEITKDMPSRWTRSASPLERDAFKAKENVKMLTPVNKSRPNDIIDTHETKSSNKWQKTQTFNSKKIKKPAITQFESKIDKPTMVTNPKEKTKKQDFVRPRSKSVDRSKTEKRKSKQSKTVADEEATKKHRKSTFKTHSQKDQKTSRKKSKTSHEDEYKKKKQRKPEKDNENTQEELYKEKKQKRKLQNDYIKTQDDINEPSKSKENLSDKAQLSRSSEKTPVSKQKESKTKSNDTIKSSNHKTTLKKSKGPKKTSNTSTIENTGKLDTLEKSKSVIGAEKLTKDEKRQKSSIPLSSKQNLKKGKTDKVKTKTLDDASLDEDLLTIKEDGKLTRPKSSPSNKSQKKNKAEDTETENASAKKGKSKDKLSPGTIQYMIHYILSNPIFINLGWTLQPTEKTLSRIVTFKAVPANPKSYCFRSRDDVEQRLYPSGTLAVYIAEDGTGHIYYPGGTPAIIVTRSDTGMKLTLYSCPTNDPLVQESFYTRIIGMFDSYGNGVIYDSNGEKILNFNQMEGIYYNPSKQTPHKWRWSCFKVLEEQRLKQLLKVMVDEVKQPVPPSRGGKLDRAPSRGSGRKLSITPEKKPVDKSYKALLEELPYPVLPKPKIKMKTHDNAFKSIVLKVNKEITVRINGQDRVAVNFSAKTLFHKMDLGVRIDAESVARVDKVADDRVDSVPRNVLTDLLHPSPSLLNLHQYIDPNTLQ